MYTSSSLITPIRTEKKTKQNYALQIKIWRQFARFRHDVYGEFFNRFALRFYKLLWNSSLFAVSYDLRTYRLSRTLRTTGVKGTL